MDTDRASRLLLLFVPVLIGGFVLAQTGFLPAPWSEDSATVTIVDADDGTTTTVDAEVADTFRERYTGLSDHDSLEDDEGMLFVHDREDERTYVMRDMDFDIDMLFIGSNGEITTIHEARAPAPGEDGEELTYSGDAKWVLEVRSGYAGEHGITPGDNVEIDYDGD